MSFAIRTFIQIASLVLTLEAALFLAKGNLGLSAENIALLAATRYDFNPNLVDSLAQQQADTWIGVVLLLIAFILQISNTLWPIRIGDFGVHKGGAICALLLSVDSYFITFVSQSGGIRHSFREGVQCTFSSSLVNCDVARGAVPPQLIACPSHTPLYIYKHQ